MARHISNARSSLLAGASAVCLALGFSVGDAEAQTCTPTSAPAGSEAGTDAYNCSGNFPTGVALSSSGDLVVNYLTNQGDIGGQGFNLTGAGADDVFFNAGAEIDGVALTGPLVDITTNSGDIVVNAAALDADQATATGMTHGLSAISTSGDIALTITGVVDAEASGANVSGFAGVEARTGGGGSASLTTASVQGRLYGIFAEVAGTGALTINAGSASAHSTAGVAGIYASTGSGDLSLSGVGSASSGNGVLIDADGDVTFTGRGTATGLSGQYGVYVSNVVLGTTTTLNLTGNTTGTQGGVFAQGQGDLAINIVGEISGLSLNLAGMSAVVPVTLQEEVVWAAPQGLSTAGGGNYSVRITERAALASHGAQGIGLEAPTVVNFASGDMVLINEGYVVVGPSTSTFNPTLSQAELRLVGLSEFRHSGRVLLGGSGFYSTEQDRIGGSGGIPIAGSDGWYDDILSLPGATWIGEGGDVVFDVDLSRTQSNCDRGVDGYLSAADCLKIIGGATEGITHLLLNDVRPGDRGRLNEEGILLVDVAGGASAGGHFVISPDTLYYSPMFGGSIDKGVFQYVLAYDEAQQSHKLVGILGGAPHQFPMLATAAQSLWRTTTSTWLDRQVDLRADGGSAVGGGMWLRLAGEQIDRNMQNGTTIAGTTYAFDNAHQQASYAVSGGVDILQGAEGDKAYVAGIMAGYGHSDVNYAVSPNRQRFDAWSLGFYGSYINRGLYLDAAVNANNVVLDNDTPGLNLFPEGTILSSRLLSVGGQLELGYRIQIEDGIFVEPNAAVSYVISEFDDVVILPDDPNRPGITLVYDEPASLRSALGARAGLTRALGAVRAEFSVLGRIWNEHEGENRVVLRNDAFPDDPDISLVDTLDGRFSEVGATANLSSSSGAVTGFLNVGGKFADNYEAKSASAGVRVNW